MQQRYNKKFNVLITDLLKLNCTLYLHVTLLYCKIELLSFCIETYINTDKKCCLLKSKDKL